MEVAKGSLPSNTVTGGGVTLDGFASRGRKAGGTAPGQDTWGAELPQQNLGSALTALAAAASWSPLMGSSRRSKSTLGSRG